MTDNSRYDIAAIRELLLAAFTAEDLKQFCEDRPAFRPILKNVSDKPTPNEIVGAVITYCQRQNLLGELLAQVKKNNPGQYERFESKLHISVDTSGQRVRGWLVQAPRKSVWLGVVAVLVVVVLAILLVTRFRPEVATVTPSPTATDIPTPARTITPTFTPTAAETATAIPTETPTPIGGQIAYTSGPDGSRDIYMMNADGTGQTRLTKSPADDQYPSWSPDGKRIVFTSDRDGKQQLYIVDVDTGTVTRVSHNAANDRYPCWSPDGERIAFVSDRDGNEEIYLLEISNREETRLTVDPPTDPAIDSYPSWSPGGTHIAFTSDRSGNSEIWVMADDGTALTNITSNKAGDWEPSWSPDGTRIAFTSNRDGNNEIYTMHPNGSQLLNVTKSLHCTDWLPSWSPDGERIAFVSNRDGNAEIYVARADGTGIRRLTDNKSQDTFPAWFGRPVTTPLSPMTSSTALSTSKATPADTPKPTTPVPTGEPPLPSGYELYDDYEGGWDTSLWQPPYGVGPCEMARENGELKIDCDDRGVEEDAFMMTISAKELVKNSILHGVAMAAVNEGNSGITNLAVTYIDVSGEEIGAYFMNLGPALVEVWEVTDLTPDNWQQRQLGKSPVSESPWHVLQIEFRESGLRFLVDGQEIDLDQQSNPPVGANYVDWKIEGFVCQDQVLNARVAWAAWNASQR